MSERWAHCDPCRRWFYVEQDDAAVRDLRCPVCQTRAIHAARRDTTTEGAI